jgi:proteasome accessory factor A
VASEVEWAAKWRILDALRRREGTGWSAPRVLAADLQWSDIRPERSLVARLAAAGAVEVLFNEDEVAAAVAAPPPDTRAWLRGRAVDRFAPNLAAAGWDSATFDLPGDPVLRRLPLPDPWRGTRPLVGDLLEAAPNAAALLEAVAGPSGA